jgi:hypothetical protein
MMFVFLLLPALSLAQGIQPTPFSPFGMAGLARGQVARLNVVNLVPPDPIEPRDQPPDPCRLVLGFADSNGRPFFTPSGAPVRARVSLGPGQAAFLDLTPADAFPRDSREMRMQFRGRVGGTPPDDNAPPNPCADMVATLEIFDISNGRTQAIYALPQVGGNPPDDGTPQ